MASLKIVLTLCMQCKRDTQQDIVFKHRETEADNDIAIKYGSFISHHDYMVIKCRGCETISFLLRHSGDFFEDSLGNPQPLDENFPNINDFDRYDFLSEDDHESLPDNLYRLYDELKNAFVSESNVLAGMGLRVMVEAVCLNQKIPGRNLQEKIKNLHGQGFISSSEMPILDKLRLIGNSSAHEIKALPLAKLEYALGIINHVIKSIYILPKLNKKLKL